MRTIDVTIGDRHFSFPWYKGRVGVDVKYHGRYAEPSVPEAKAIWGKLDEKTQDKLQSLAHEDISEWWWQNAAEELDDFAVERDGRSGGYLVFTKATESFVLQLEDDATLEECEYCGNFAAGVHMHAERMFRDATLPLPFPDAPWDLECVHCKEFYWTHVSGRCLMHLGSVYEPHTYQGGSLQFLIELEEAVAKVEKMAERDNIKDMLDNSLNYLLLDHPENYRELIEDADT